MRRTPITFGPIPAAPLMALLVVACSPDSPSSDADDARHSGDTDAEVTAVREGYLEGAGGARLHYRVLGSGSDTFVALHGGPGAGMHSILESLEPLARGHVIIFYDQRGGGRSELPDDTARLHARYFVEDLEAVRRHFGLERMNLYTHSFGAILAAAYAREHPDRVDRMIFHGATGPRRAEAARLARADRPDADGALSRRAGEVLRELLAGTARDPVAACREYERLLREIAIAQGASGRWSGTTCAAPPEAVHYYYLYTAQLAPRTFGDWDFTTGMEHITAPLLVIYGARDSLAIPQQRAWAEALPNGRVLLVPDATKAAITDRPDVVLPAIETFLDGRWPARTEPPR